ncbi:ribose-phosphate pyrophosphokinase [Candidatus Palauibacter soopunensis]|uniref:ribose-phosphate diphosphokinase n=1 Tax=Candidatus Palauibacter soopunensis TaxID=3056739 RepID=UPI0023A678AD|nr:ribose-phosphate pyrophosphokinase [Candidatus Palauibacter soopunensis]MDE2878815.1 ribose-phosphate pyrophosphokinase [Candidatus Palauibacter soopunensis]
MDTTDFSFHTSPIMLLSGTANPALAQGIADVLGERLCDVTIKRFADGEIFVRIDENVRGRDVFLIQPTNPPAENVLELLILLDAAKRASAARVTAVVPYYGYGRSDRKDQPRVSIAAKLLANLMTAAGADRVLSIDFHQHQIQGFFDIPVDHLYAAPVFRRYYEMKKLDNLVVVATDVSAAKMARGYARRLGGDLAIIDKRRPAPNEAEVSNIVGEVEGKHCIVPDDMIDTAGTMVSAIEVLKERGALDIYILATHPLFSGPAVERIASADVKEITVTDTVPLAPGVQEALPNLTVLSVASLLAQAIESTHENTSVSKLFK